jgi:hypothetical protein
MRRFQQIAPGVGLLLFGFATAAAVIQGCAPGKICDNPEYQIQCEMRTGGSGGGGTGGGGTGGGGSGGGGGTAALSASTAVPECPTEFNTLGKMDNFFAMRCGHEGPCHTSPGSAVWSDLKMPNVYSRMLDAPTKGTCIGMSENKIIDKADWQKSLMLVKTRDAMPKCKNGSTAGAVMPLPLAMQSNVTMKQDPLTDAEKRCLENFVRVAAGK